MAIFNFEVAHRRRIGSQAIGDDRFGVPVSLQRLLEETTRCLFFPHLRHEALQDFTFMVDGSPKLMRLSIDFKTSLLCQHH